MRRTGLGLAIVCCFAGVLALSGQHTSSHWQTADPGSATEQAATPPPTLPTRAH